MNLTMSDTERYGWRSVLATFLWLLVTVGGLTLIEPVLTIMLGVGLWLTSGDPTAVVMDRYRVHTARLFGVVLYGIVWLAGIIALQPYFQRAKAIGTLLFRFFWVAAAEAGFWGLKFLFEWLVLRIR